MTASSVFCSKGIFRLCGFLLIALPLPVFAVQAKEQVIWWNYNWPPVRFMEGPERGTGRADKVLKLLHERLTEFEHKGLKMNFNRFQQLAKAGDIVCSDSMLKTKERQDYLYYSVQMSFGTPKRITIKADNAHKFTNGKTLSLDTLLQNQKLKTAIKKNFTAYGTTIEAMLNKYHQQPNIMVRAFENDVFVKMMLGGRIDYVIMENSYLVQYELDRMKNPPKLATFNIAEDNNILSYHFACTKSDLGKRVIDQVNAVLLEARPTKEYRAWTFQWYLPSELPELNKYYDDVLLKSVE